MRFGRNISSPTKDDLEGWALEEAKLKASGNPYRATVIVDQRPQVEYDVQVIFSSEWLWKYNEKPVEPSWYWKYKGHTSAPYMSLREAIGAAERMAINDWRAMLTGCSFIGATRINNGLVTNTILQLLAKKEALDQEIRAG